PAGGNGGGRAPAGGVARGGAAGVAGAVAGGPGGCRGVGAGARGVGRGVAGEQPGGGDQQRLADAAGASPEGKAGAVGPQEALRVRVLPGPLVPSTLISPQSLLIRRYCAHLARRPNPFFCEMALDPPVA